MIIKAQFLIGQHFLDIDIKTIEKRHIREPPAPPPPPPNVQRQNDVIKDKLICESSLIKDKLIYESSLREDSQIDFFSRETPCERFFETHTTEKRQYLNP